MAAVSCQRESVTRVRVQIPEELRTKSVSMGQNVDIVHYEVWSADFNTLLLSDSQPISGGVLEMEIDLVQDLSYNLIFWAQHQDANSPYSWSTLKKINVDYSKLSENNKDCYDAFYDVEEILADGTDKTVILTRPFAQLNFGTTTMTASFGDFTIDSNQVTVSKYAKAFDTVNNKAVDYVETPMTIKASLGGLVQEERADKMDLKVGDTYYYWVAMNYLLVPADDNATVDVVVTFNTNIGPVSHSLPNVPLKKNYRTNIVGDLFINSSSLQVVVSPNFNTPDENKYLNN